MFDISLLKCKFWHFPKLANPFHSTVWSNKTHTTVFWEKVILLGQFTKNSKKIQTWVKKNHQKILKGKKENHNLAFSIVIHLPFLLINQYFLRTFSVQYSPHNKMTQCPNSFQLQLTSRNILAHLYLNKIYINWKKLYNYIMS